MDNNIFISQAAIYFDSESPTCRRVAVKIYNLFQRFTDWKNRHNEDAWIQAPIRWIRQMLGEHSEKLIRRAIYLLLEDGWIEGQKTNEHYRLEDLPDSQPRSHPAWCNPAYRWFFRVVRNPSTEPKNLKNDLDETDVLPLTSPNSSQNLDLRTVVEDDFLIKERGIQGQVSKSKPILRSQRQNQEVKVQGQQNSSNDLVPGEVDEKINLSEAELVRREIQRQPELDRLENLGVRLEGKLLQICLTCNLKTLVDALEALEQQTANKRSLRERIENPTKWFELALAKKYKPNQKSEPFQQNGSWREFNDRQSLEWCWAYSKGDVNSFKDVALHYGYDIIEISTFLAKIRGG